ncbi:hypothetical protein P691DRAFT_262915 [Macrolepiota fuliginosa MF-IS2]|uniref:Uncharacterized protein n=1 Tax=Macrolepiota fuliginosa MF-IS2 TaxID=1400762 RepID=A0A9P5X7M8_9AGAR|nr:hypothetical protein P691DRAFT_262915 [Macrolepiota fuliginosa MF-IS2]
MGHDEEVLGQWSCAMSRARRIQANTCTCTHHSTCHCSTVYLPCTCPPVRFDTCSAFQHILSMPLLPNPLILRPSISDLVHSFPIMSRIHLMSNIYMPVPPPPQVPERTSSFSRV